MTIGQVAKKAGVNVQTLHYYERRGVLKPQSRLESGYRVYDETAVRIIQFIKHAQELGFTLDEIQNLLSLRADRKSRCESVQEKASDHLEDVRLKIARLRAIEGTLKKLISDCKKRKTADVCPLLDCLDDEEFRLGEGGFDAV